MSGILIIDDDIQVCKALAKVMKRMDHIVECAHTLKDGLGTTHSYPNDVALLDVRLKDPLADMRLIMVLPNREQKTISLAHKIYPRFLSYADSDFKDLADVVQKMLTKCGSKDFLKKMNQLTIADKLQTVEQVK